MNCNDIPKPNIKGLTKWKVRQKNSGKVKITLGFDTAEDLEDFKTWAMDQGLARVREDGRLVPVLPKPN